MLCHSQTVAVNNKHLTAMITATYLSSMACRRNGIDAR
jgi:hypothetical protein